MIDQVTTADLAEAARPKSVMEDPSSVAVARTYADAFLQASGNDADAALEEFTSLRDDVLTRTRSSRTCSPARW